MAYKNTQLSITMWCNHFIHEEGEKRGNTFNWNLIVTYKSNQKGKWFNIYVIKKYFWQAVSRTKTVHNRWYFCHLFILVDLNILTFHSFTVMQHLLTCIVHVTVARKIIGSSFSSIYFTILTWIVFCFSPPPPSTNVRYYFSNPNNYKNLNNEVAITDLSSLPPFKLPSNISAFIWQRLFVDVLVSPTLTLICLFGQPFFVFFSHSFF